LSHFPSLPFFFVFLFFSRLFQNHSSDPNDQVAVTIGRIFISVLVAFSYPLQTHPSRICVDNLYRVVVTDWLKRRTSSQTLMRFMTETSLLIAGTFLVGLLVSDLAVVLALVGATGSTTMCYILPGLFYLKMEQGTPWTVKKTFAAILAVLGIIIMPTAVVFIFVQL